MRKLIEGIVNFREQVLPQYEEHFRRLSQGQTPDALFITCSDSRVVPDLLMSTDPGDLFVMRNVGNLIPPATIEGSSTGDLSEASAIEFSVLVLGVQSIVVCGHSECGAMKAAMERKPTSETPNLNKWLHHCNTALFRLDQEGPLNRALPAHDQLSQINVLVQLEHLMSYPIVRQRVHAGALQLGGWWFDIAQARMLSYERETRAFEPIDRRAAERLMQRLAPAGTQEA
ncbi:MAG TPA: carbonic anhydrase [Pirellulales bacterium]|nr:carbonic anhydrase [Pirellulales bacterium]